MIKQYMRGHRGISLPALGFVLVVVAIIVAAYLALRGGSNEDETSPQPAASVSPTHTTTESGATDATPENSTSAESTIAPEEDVSDSVQKRMIALIEAYYLLKPDDTPDDRHARMDAFGYPATAFAQLTYYVGTLSCGDQARLDEENPLTQQAYVTESGITVRQPDEQVPFTYVTATFVVAQVNQKGDLYSGTADCPASAQLTAAATWQQEDNGSWTLLSFNAPEAPL